MISIYSLINKDKREQYFSLRWRHFSEAEKTDLTDGDTGVGSRCSSVRDSRSDYWIDVLSRVFHHAETAASDIAINYIINVSVFTCWCFSNSLITAVCWICLLMTLHSPSPPRASDDRRHAALATHMPRSSRWQSNLVVMQYEVTDSQVSVPLIGNDRLIFLWWWFSQRFQGKEAESIFRTLTMSCPFTLTTLLIAWLHDEFIYSICTF